MADTRFLHIQIYNSTNTQVEYDNKTDDTWGISAGTAVLERSIMENELKFGSVIANQFEVQVFGINVKLEKRRIIVTMDYTYDDEGLIKTDSDDFLVTDTGDYLKAFNSSEDTEIQLFDGIIDSSKTDNTRTYRDIIAYDRFYVDRDTDISAWWNNYWGLNADGTATGNVTTTLGALMSTLLTYMGFTYTKPPMINDSISLKTADMFYYSALTFGEVFSMMCILQNVCPNIAGDGTLEFINLDTDVSYLHNNAEGLNSYWEDFTTETITGVGVYDTSTELAQLVGTNNNVYCIVANIFLLCQSASDINTICGRILNGLSNITYTPCQLRAVVSKPLDYKLGAKLYTEHGTAYILQDRLSGSLLIDEEIVSPAISATLSKDVDPISDNFRQAGKIAQIKRDIDKFTIDYADFKQDVTTEFEQTASTIVLKATTGGRIVKAELGADPSTGTSFKVKADDIAFIANGKIELTSNSLQINSTNFKVDASGNITATNADITGKIQSNEGKIGGWEITNEGFEGVSIQMFSGRSGQGYYVPGYIQLYNDSSQTQYITLNGDGGISGNYGGVSFGLGAGSELGPNLSLYDDNSIFDHKNTNVIYYSWGIVVNRYEEDNARPDFDIMLGENGTLNVEGDLGVGGDLACINVNTGGVINDTPNGSSWNKARDKGFIRSLGFNNDGFYYPAVVWRHQGGDWSMGSLGNSKRLYFSHVRDAEYSGNNYSDIYYIDPPADGNAHSYQIAHSGNVGTGDSNGQVKIAGVNVSVKGWNNFLPLSGGTVTGTLILSRNTDASGTANNKPALIVGGTDTQAHIEIDNNEILAKESGTTTGNLYLQDGGSLHFCADTYAFDKGRLNFAKALTNSNVSAPNYVVGFTNSWGAFGYTALSALATTMFKIQETKISFKFSIALGAHSGMTFANARGSAFSVSVPSGYTLMCNVYCCANGFGGLWATLDGDVYTSTSPGIYLYNSSNSTLSTSTTVTVRVVSVFRKS